MDEIGRKQFIQDLNFWMKEDPMIEGNDIFVISEPLEDYGLTIEEVKILVKREFGYEVEIKDGDVKIVKRNYFGKIMLIDYGTPNSDKKIKFFNKDDIKSISNDKEELSENAKKLLINVLKDTSKDIFIGVYGIPYVNNNDYIATNQIFKKLDELKEKYNEWDFLISSSGNNNTITKIISNWCQLNNKLYFVTKYDMDIDDFNTIVISDESENFVAEKFAVKLSYEFKHKNWDNIWQILHEYFILEDYSMNLEKLLKVAVSSRYYIHIDW